MTHEEFRAFSRGYNEIILDKNATNPYDTVKPRSAKRHLAWDAGKARAHEVITFHKKDLSKGRMTATGFDFQIYEEGFRRRHNLDY